MSAVRHEGLHTNEAQLALVSDRQPGNKEGGTGGKALRAGIQARTVDYTGPYMRLIQERLKQPDRYGIKLLQPTAAGALKILPPLGYIDQPANSFATKFVHMSWNKVRASMNAITWNREGRRCITGSNVGEFTQWEGRTFAFEHIIQAHETPIRTARFLHCGEYMLSSDDAGVVKYWKRHLDSVKAIQAHNEAVRGVCVSPTDLKFATASDDSTLKIWDFKRAAQEGTLRGHGGDVRWCDWHPSKGALASASKDNVIKLWDPRGGGDALATLQGHNATIMQVHWNLNGNWLLSASRDSLCKVYDARMLRELATFRGHAKDVICAEWHPIHEDLFVSGSYDGSLCYWLVSLPNGPQAAVQGAHDGQVLSMAWHPAGHLLATGGGDTTTKFWCRARPGDPWVDRARAEQEQGATTESGDSRGMAGSASAASDVIPGIPGIGDAGARRPPAPPLADPLAGPHGGGLPPPPAAPGFPPGWPPPPPPPRGAMPPGRHPGGPQWRGGPPRGGAGRGGPGFRPRALGPGPGPGRGGRAGGGPRIMRPQQAGAPAQFGAGSAQRPGAPSLPGPPPHYPRPPQQGR
ncbi:pre-mRNA 3' end processing protein WDR33 [Coccomyxa sp. Obi]|nr:pre-mRNA 3' end processing protein WDR33 [Coccomyxa sp. Obi]